jgi:hypothetical protein
MAPMHQPNTFMYSHTYDYVSRTSVFLIPHTSCPRYVISYISAFTSSYLTFSLPRINHINICIRRRKGIMRLCLARKCIPASLFGDQLAV